MSLLDETEIQTLEAFFALQKGAAGTFEFEDPDSGVVYANCRFEQDQVEFEASELFEHKGRLRIRTV